MATHSFIRSTKFAAHSYVPGMSPVHGYFNMSAIYFRLSERSGLGSMVGTHPTGFGST